ncbi:MAG: hypothetical protein K1X92_07950 [Bacteroidia bacterium]|nr:hypothetical protein [Bacteroidia bacterium]
MKHLSFYLLVFLTLLLTSLRGQAPFQPFRSTDFNEFVASEHFDVYYKSGNEAMATRVAKYAEMARGELGFLYDYKPSSRYIFVLVNHPHEMMFTNYHFQPNDGYYPYGIIPLPKLDAAVVVPDDPARLYNVVKHSVSSVILKEFEYGQDLPNVIQNELLNFKPSWFYEGITDFVANGWTYRDELLLQSMEGGRFTLQALEGQDEGASIIRKSVWFFIAHEYGPQKFAELVYLSKITHSVETSIVGVLGIPLRIFTERWNEFLVKHIDELGQNRIEISALPEAKTLSLPKGYTSGSFAFAEKTNMLALYVKKNGVYSLWTYDLTEETFKDTGIKFGYKNDTPEKEKTDFALAWTPKGDQLIYTVYKKDQWQLWSYDLASATTTLAFTDSSVQRIQHIAFSGNGKKIAFSAMQDGKADIWTGNSDFSGLRKITNDLYDDVNPAWSYDDNVLYFCSNRDTNLLNAKELPQWDYFTKLYDIVALNVNEKTDTLTFITRTPNIQERLPQNPNSYEVYYLSDESGLWDLYRRNLFTGVSEPLTKTECGLDYWQPGVLGQKMVASTYKNGVPSPCIFDLPQSGISPLNPTAFRQEFLALLNQNKKESVPGEEPSLTPWEGEKDSTETPLRYYIFDDNIPDNHTAKTGKNKKKESEMPEIILKNQPEWRDLRVSRGEKFKNQWRAEYLQASLVYHAVPRAGVMFGAGFHDLQHHHRISASVTPYFNMLPFIQFGNSDAKVRYNYQKLRPDFFIESGGWIRQYQQEAFSASVLDSLAYRFTNLYGKAGVTWPVSPKLQVGFSQAIHSINKQDLRLVYATSLSDEKRTAGLTALFADFSNLTLKEDYPWKGNVVHAEMNFCNTFSSSQNNFQTFSLSARHYQPIWKNIVLAGNFQSAFSFGDRKQVFYMGGIDNWFLGILRRNRPGSPAYTGKLSMDVTDFAFQEFVMPVRGFWFNARNGNKYLLTNWDLRIPLSRTSRPVLNAKPRFDWELIPFFDVGTVWRTGNPFSQKNPTDLQTIYGNPVTVQLQTLKSPFLMGFGSGVKTQLLNYTARMDVAWGVDDNTIQSPVITLALGRAF